MFINTTNEVLPLVEFHGSEVHVAVNKTVLNTKPSGFRFSLKSVLLALTIVCLLTGAIANWVTSARRQRQAVAALEPFGCRITGDLDRISTDQQTRWQRWLRRKFGYDYVRTVDDVQFGYQEPLRRFSNDDVQLLTELPWLKNVAFYNTDVTADGLKPLRSLKHLERIFLDQSDTSRQRRRPKRFATLCCPQKAGPLQDPTPS